MLWLHSGGLYLKVKSHLLKMDQLIMSTKQQISINLVFNLEGDKYTKIGIAIIIQVLEGLHAICYRSVS